MQGIQDIPDICRYHDLSRQLLVPFDYMYQYTRFFFSKLWHIIRVVIYMKEILSKTLNRIQTTQNYSKY